MFLGQNVQKKFGNRVFQTFGIFRIFGIFGIFGNCSILNFPKITKK